MRHYPKKRCKLCVKHVEYVDYKNIDLLKVHTTFYARIQPKRYTGNCVFHQKMVSTAIKNARHMAFLPFISN